MTFLSPLSAGIAAAIAIPALLILYFLKLRRRNLEVSSTLLWKKAIEDLQANAPFQRLRNNILLILQLLILIAALLSIAQPQFVANLAPGGKHIIMIDRSASMQAIDGDLKNPGKLTRLEAGKKGARDLVDSLKEPGVFGSAGDEAMVIAFDMTGERLVNFTGNRAELKRAIDSIEPVDTPSRLGPAWTLAKAYSRPPEAVEGKGFVAQGPGAVVHLFSDGRLSDALEVRPEIDDTVVYMATGGKDAGNVGITAIRAERSFDDPGKVSIFVAVQSTVMAARKVEVALAVDNNAAEIKDIMMPAATKGVPTSEGPAEIVPQIGGIVFSLDRPTAARLTVQLRFPDDPAGGPNTDLLEVDNNAYVVLPPTRRLSLAFVTDGNLILQAMLTDRPEATVEVFNLARPVKTVRTADAQAFIDSPEAAEYDVLVLDRWLPQATIDGKKQSAIPIGRSLIFGAFPEPPLGLARKGETDQAIPLTWRSDHPVLRGLSLDALIIGKSPITEPVLDAPISVLAQGTGGPLIVEASDIDRRAIYTTFDLAQSTWFTDPTLPLFIVRSLDYFARGSSADKANPLQPGQTMSEKLPRGAMQVRITAPPPDSKVFSLVPSAAGDVNFGPVQNVGFYTLGWEGPPSPTDTLVGGNPRRTLAANLLDPQESDIATRPTLALASKVIEATQTGQGLGTVLLWPWLLLLAALIMLVEWYIYNRKVTL